MNGRPTVAVPVRHRVRLGAPHTVQGIWAATNEYHSGTPDTLAQNVSPLNTLSSHCRRTHASSRRRRQGAGGSAVQIRVLHLNATDGCAENQQRHFVCCRNASRRQHYAFRRRPSSPATLSTKFGDKPLPPRWTEATALPSGYAQIQRWRDGKDCKRKKRFVYRGFFYFIVLS